MLESYSVLCRMLIVMSRLSKLLLVLQSVLKLQCRKISLIKRKEDDLLQAKFLQFKMPSLVLPSSKEKTIKSKLRPRLKSPLISKLSQRFQSSLKTSYRYLAAPTNLYLDLECLAVLNRTLQLYLSSNK